MTVKDVLQNGISILKNKENGIDMSTPYLDALVLLSEALNVSKEKLYLYFNDEVNDFGYERYNEFIEKRCSGIPVSYIREKKEFYGLDFYVDKRVLVPRPETEFLVYEALEIIKNKITEEGRLNLNILDVCTGSGCIAVSLAHEIDLYSKDNRFNNIRISACDISRDVEKVFRMNSKIILGRELKFFCSDLLSNTNETYDIIISNPPYLTTENVKEMKERSWPEPYLALDGGKDGLDLVFKLIEQAKVRLKDQGCLLLEADDNQMEKIKSFMLEQGFKNIRLIKDLSGWNRIAAGCFPDKVYTPG